MGGCAAVGNIPTETGSLLVVSQRFYWGCLWLKKVWDVRFIDNKGVFVDVFLEGMMLIVKFA